MTDRSSHDRNGAVARLLRAAQLLRPRTIAQLAKNDDRLQQQLQTLTEEVQTLKAQLGHVTRQERQLRTLFESEYDSNDDISRFDALVRTAPIADHIQAAVARAPMQYDPFPHCVVDDLLPAAYYDALIAALPPAELFADRPVNKQQLTVPLELAPRYSMEVWRHMAKVVAEGIIRPTMLAKFHEPLTAWLREKLAALGISNGSRVVVYYGNDWVTPSTRVVFTLDYAGLGGRTSLLDGGMQLWKEQKRPLTSEISKWRIEKPMTLCAGSTL
jgi:hypothetical protein